ncbi:MAG: 2-oxo-hepta-3-ene-1,7-dioic acid hydratase [Pseudomonadales bacterium]|nr:2-oxo-hepta-3-ene-1,7-dioic acid hydratase [Pseudomonadales bacterium]NIX09912.1 2-oxo-hepta-3-ene-1,7-dioic acid hydratase [Pseudomonadales bacterium]
MLSREQVRSAAVELDTAERDRRQIRPTSVTYQGMTVDDAYAVQQAWLELKIDSGRQIVGRKVGLTSRAMQEAMRINEPDFGTLLDDMMFEEGASLEAEAFLDPRIEVELAFVLGQTLDGAEVGLDDVLAATDYVTPALEIIAARSFRVDPETGSPRTVVDTIADNAANAGVIVGGRRVRPDELDLRWVSALLYRNGIIEETGVAAGVLDHPANGVVWLARKFAEHGVALERGQIVLAGSFTRPVAVCAGDQFRVDYGPLGEISCCFD